MEASVETTPLLTPKKNDISPSFFKRLSIKPTQAIKAVTLTVASGFSSLLYWSPSISAGASVNEVLKYPAAIGGVVTNFIFNLESYYALSRQFPELLNKPYQLSLATFFSIACVAPNFFMNMVDEEGNYVDETKMTLQGISAFFSIGVNIVGSMALINSLSFLLKNKTTIQKEKLLEKIHSALDNYAVLYPAITLNDLNKEKLIELLAANHDLSSHQKISYYSLNTGIGLLCIPQFTAYLLVSYFGMRDLAEKKWGTSFVLSNILASIAAISNGIPGAGFSIKGVNSISKDLMSLEKPSLLALLFILPALFSGFTTHKAMADGLNELGYSGSMAEALKWTANLGAALIYNLPQMLALAKRLNAPTASKQLNDLKNHLENKVKKLNSIHAIHYFKNNFSSQVSIFLNAASNKEEISLQSMLPSAYSISNI